MAIKLITVDMDQTFLRSDKTYDKDRFEELFKELKKRGVVFSVASGNAYYNLDHYFSEEIRPEIYFCGDDGNFIIKNEKKLAERSLDEDLVERLIEFLTNYEDSHEIIASTGDKTYATYNDDPFVVKNMDIYYFESEYFGHAKDFPTKEINRLTLLGDVPLAENKKIMDEINEEFPELEAVTPGDNWVNIYAQGGGKGSAIRFLQKSYNIKAEESIAFGDSLNDRSMMEVVEYSCGVDNADPELFESCKYRIGSNEDQAVLDIIEGLLEDESLVFMDKYKI